MTRGISRARVCVSGGICNSAPTPLKTYIYFSDKDLTVEIRIPRPFRYGPPGGGRIFFIQNLYCFLCGRPNQPTQGRVTDRDHQVLANDRRGRERNLGEEMPMLLAYILPFRPFVIVICRKMLFWA